MTTTYKRTYDNADINNNYIEQNKNDKVELYNYIVSKIKSYNVQITEERMSTLSSLNEFINEHIQSFDDSNTDPQNLENAKRYWDVLISVMINQLNNQ